MTWTRDVAGRQLLPLRRLRESLAMPQSTPPGHTCPTNYGGPERQKIWECWQVQPIVEEVRNAVWEEHPVRDLNEKAGAV